MSKKWYKLDLAALIFPAMIHKDWSNCFRLSIELNDDIDPIILEKALNSLRRRFPTFFVRLKKGLFWYYLEQTSKDIKVLKEYAYPLTHMNGDETRKCCTRVLYFKNRISVEIFHVVTDGNGGKIYLLNLAKRYIELKYNITINDENMDKYYLYDSSLNAPKEELEDGFPKTNSKAPLSIKENNSYRLKGTRNGKFNSLITGIIDTDKLKEVAHSYNSTITSFISSVMIESIIKIQNENKKEKSFKDVNICVPVNLRKTYGIHTIRNFILPVNVGVDPKLGSYTLNEIISAVNHELKIESSPQRMNGRIASNLIPRENPIIRATPLFIKKIFLRAVYRRIGERKGSINVSNLGNVELPISLNKYIKRMDFIIGPQYYYKNNCSVISYNGKTYINFIRNIKETRLEELFFSRLVDLSIPVEIESNDGR